MIRDLVTDPDSFFRHRAENPGLLIPFGIVLIASLLAAAIPYLEPTITGQLFEQAAQQQGQQVNQSTIQALSSAVRTLGIVISFLGAFVS